MDEPKPMPKSPSRSLLAILIIAGLLVGLVVGYVIPRPAPVDVLGPVEGLDRPNTIPLVTGWYRGESVDYLDYGIQPNIAIPILAFFLASSPDTPVAGQQNIIDAIPGQPGYSDFWRVFKVLVPSSYVPNTIRSFDAAFASGYPIEATDIIVNCPVVNPGAMIEGSSANPVSGWYRDRQVFYFDHGANSEGEGYVVHTAPIYAFFFVDGTAVPGQGNVIDVLPGDAGYSDLWHVVAVTVAGSYVANTLTDADDILAEAEAGNLELAVTTILVNCPVVP